MARKKRTCIHSKVDTFFFFCYLWILLAISGLFARYLPAPSESVRFVEGKYLEVAASSNEWHPQAIGHTNITYSGFNCDHSDIKRQTLGWNFFWCRWA